MRLNTKLMEWFFVAGLAILTITMYFMFRGGLTQTMPQTTMMNMTLLMILGGEFLLGILAVRIIEILSQKKR